MEQIEPEISSLLDFVDKVYKLLGFETYQVFLSTRPEKHMGKLSDWDMAEESLKSALEKRGMQWTLNPGDGAFYGPKIDFRVQDAIGRSHQTATIQLDFQLPSRFDLKYVAEDHSHKAPVIIHRAILGSVERMMAIMIEHFAGKWPFWLSPRQAIIIPTRPELHDFAKSVAQQLNPEGELFIDVDLSDKTLGKKIREAQHLQYNYQLIVGDKELKQNTVSIRKRDGAQMGALSIEETLQRFQSEMKT